MNKDQYLEAERAKNSTINAVWGGCEWGGVARRFKEGDGNHCGRGGGWDHTLAVQEKSRKPPGPEKMNQT